MKKNKLFITCAAVMILFGFIFTGSLRAENKDTDKKETPEFTGSFMLGYRFVDLTGTSVESKYKEDINLEKGPRLFNVKIHYAPRGDLKKLVDSLDLRIYNLGGDPFESFGLSAVKYGKYELKYDHKKAAYFYSDRLKAGDIHTFDFDRVMDSGMLKVWLNKEAHFYVNFDRYTKKGNSVTSYDINRLDVEFDKPIDEKSNEITLGADYSCNLFAVVLEEKIMDYKSTNTLFLPGYIDGGENASYPSAIYYFNLNQPYDIKGNTFVAKVTFKPFKNLLLHGNGQVSNQETNIGYSESSAGIDYLGDTYEYAYTGSGKFKTRIYTANADLTYILSRKFAIVGAARYNKYDQKEATFTIGSETETPFLKYETGEFEGGLQFQPSSKFGLTAGYRFEKRDIKTPDTEPKVEEENLTTSNKGFYGDLKMKLFSHLDVTTDYQHGSYDNPFTIMSPSTFNRVRVLLKYNLKKFYANVSYLYNKSTSDVDDEGTETRSWESTKNQSNIRFGYHGDKVKLFAGYGYMSVTRKGDRVIFYPPGWSGAAGSFVWDILFEGKTYLYDALLDVSLRKELGVGGRIDYYQNKGSWALSRLVMKAFLKYEFECGLMGELGYRYVDFKEKKDNLNNYKAGIFEVSFGYRW